MWLILKSRFITLFLALLTEAVAVWAVFYSKSLVLKLFLAFMAVLSANAHLMRLNRPPSWADIWWSWPLILLIIVGIATFVLAIAHFMGLL